MLLGLQEEAPKEEDDEEKIEEVKDEEETKEKKKKKVLPNASACLGTAVVGVALLFHCWFCGALTQTKLCSCASVHALRQVLLRCVG